MNKIKLYVLITFTALLQATSPITDGVVLIRFQPNSYPQIELNKINQIYNIEWGTSLLDPKFVDIKNNLKKQLSKKLIKAQNELLRTYKITYFDNYKPLEFVKILKTQFKKIEIAEPVYIPVKQGIDDFNDSLVDQQRLLNVIKAFEAWEIEDGDENIVIGISDDGVDQGHSDLKDNLYINQDEIQNNGIDDDNNGYIDDYNGYNLAFQEDEGMYGITSTTVSHGTQVAGIAGASANNSIGLVGVGNKCKLFPLKISPANNHNMLTYAYESIIVAANMGLDVLNMSWGLVKPFSPIDQSIVDYAVGKGLILVSSVGNKRLIRTEYPSGYNGVLGVGSSRADDIAYSGNNYGFNNQILAPGEGAISTNLDNKYTNQNSLTGSSFAAPIVAGALGIVKARYPNLTPLQYINFIRQMTDKVISKNSSRADYIPGRLNLLKAVTTDPMSIPAVCLESHEKVNENGIKIQRTDVNQSYFIRLNLFNHLATYQDLNFELSIANTSVDKSLKINTSSFILDEFRSNENRSIEFSVTNLQSNFDDILMRVDISGPNNYSDFFLFYLTPTENYYTFENNSIKISIDDRGKVGFFDDNQYIGDGVNHKSLGNQIRMGGLISYTNQDAHNSHRTQSDYVSIKKFSDDNNISIIENLRDDQVPIRIQNTVMMSKNLPLVRMDFVYSNLSKNNISTAGLGFSFDWDIGNFNEFYLNNNSELLENLQAPNQDLKGQYIFNADEDIWLGTAMFSNEIGAQAHAAGFMLLEIAAPNLDEDEIISLLQSGTQQQTNQRNDLGSSVGVNFQNGIKANQSVECSFCLAIAKTKEEIDFLLTNCYQNNLDSIVSVSNKINFQQLGNTILFNEVLINSSISVYNLTGKILHKDLKPIMTEYDFSFLEDGLYLIQIESENNNFSFKFFKN